MKYVALKSNHGNHSGFNRKWEILDKSENINDLKSILFNHAENCSDDLSIDEQGNVIDLSRNGEILFNSNDESFNYDGRSYVIVSIEEYNNGYFNGASNGYAPTEAVKYFEKKKIKNK